MKNRFFLNTSNNNRLKYLLSALALMLLFTTLNAQETVFSDSKDFNEIASKKHNVNMCPGGVAFGIFSFNYEYLHNNRHGLVFRFDYENIPDKYTDANLDAWGAGIIFNYRYHLEETLDSWFLGSFARGRLYKGTGVINNEDYDFELPDYTIGLNAGRKWVWGSGFTITVNLGYGLNFSQRNLSSNTNNFESYVKEFEDDYMFAGGFLGEFSIGYAF